MRKSKKNSGFIKKKKSPLHVRRVKTKKKKKIKTYGSRLLSHHKKATSGKSRPLRDKNVSKRAVFEDGDIKKVKLERFVQMQFLYLRNMKIQNLELKSKYVSLRVLDVSFNNIFHLHFLEKTPNIRHVFASGNKIQHFSSIPFVPSIRTLALSGNHIRSFESFGKYASNLEVLSLHSNRIENFSFLPDLPMLQSIDLRENKVCQLDYFLKILLSSMGRTDGITINGEMIQASKNLEMSNHKVLMSRKKFVCLRLGIIPRDSLVEKCDFYLDKINSRAVKQSPLQLVKIGILGEHMEGKRVTFTPFFKIVGADFERKITPCKNMTYHTFKLNCKKEKILLSMVNRPILMDRAPRSDDHLLRLFIPSGTYRYNYVFDGVPEKTTRNVEVIQTRTPKKMPRKIKKKEYSVSIRWLRDNKTGDFDEIDGADDMVYLATKDDVKHVLKAEMVLKRNGRPVFHVYWLTDEIQSGVPKCEKLKIEGQAVSGNVLKCDAKYDGGEEGESIVTFYSTKNPSSQKRGEWKIMEEDVGHQIVCEYTPVRADGVEGEMVKVKTKTVVQAPPQISNVRFDGFPQEGEKLRVVYDYFGGSEGKTQIKWIRHAFHPDEKEKAIKRKGKQYRGPVHVLTYTNRKVFKLGLKDVNKFVEVQVTPKNSSGEKGETTCLMTGRVSEALPRIVSGDFEYSRLQEGKVVTFQSRYVGGLEGKSLCKWFKKLPSGENESQINESTGMSYTAGNEDVGYRLIVKYTPVSIDGMVGEEQVFETDDVVGAGDPLCMSLKLDGDAVLDGVVKVVSSYYGGGEGESQYKWYRVDADNNKHMYSGEEHMNTKQYQIWQDDVGSRIMVEYVPTREDGLEGESVFAFSDVVTEK